MKCRKPRWCLTCASAAKVECLVNKEHISVAISPDSLQLMSNIMPELENCKAASRSMLCQALEKQNQLSQNLFAKHKSAQLVLEKIEQDIESNKQVEVEIILMQQQVEDAKITDCFDLNAIASELTEEQVVTKLNLFKTDIERMVKASKELLHKATLSLHENQLQSNKTSFLLFQMIVKQDDKVKGEIHIRPTLRDRNLLKLLGEFCAESPKQLWVEVIRQTS